MARKRRSKAPKRVESFRHEEAKRPNLPSAEHQSVMSAEEQTPIRSAIERRNRDLDPQLVWRGKKYDEELQVHAPPLFIQEKVHPKALIDDLKRVAAEEEPAVPTELRKNHFVGRARREVVPQVHHVFAKRFHAAGQRLAQVLVDQEGHAAILRSKATAASTSSRRRPHQSQAA